MPRPFVALLSLSCLLGCAQGPWLAASGPAPAVPQGNPLFIPSADYQHVWDAVVDVVGDYFRIDREEPVRLLGGTLTEGRIETFPKMGATWLEPWDQDSVTACDRWECTLQSLRRRAALRIVPEDGGGFWVDLAVFKELENCSQPEYSPSAAAMFNYDNSLTRVINPDRTLDTNRGWIPLGRDFALEQRILAQLQYRLSPAGQPIRL